MHLTLRICFLKKVKILSSGRKVGRVYSDCCDKGKKKKKHPLNNTHRQSNNTSSKQKKTSKDSTHLHHTAGRPEGLAQNRCSQQMKIGNLPPPSRRCPNYVWPESPGSAHVKSGKAAGSQTRTQVMLNPEDEPDVVYERGQDFLNDAASALTAGPKKPLAPFE
jgi:hypothetical protein